MYMHCIEANWTSSKYPNQNVSHLKQLSNVKCFFFIILVFSTICLQWSARFHVNIFSRFNYLTSSSVVYGTCLIYPTQISKIWIYSVNLRTKHFPITWSGFNITVPNLFKVCSNKNINKTNYRFFKDVTSQSIFIHSHISSYNHSWINLNKT